MCKERWRTRDRLLEYDDAIMPPRPHRAGLRMVYPWEDLLSITVLEKKFYQLAVEHGYTGDMETFWERFIYGNVHTGTLAEFPEIGDEHDLYLDVETDILYYFKATSETVYSDIAARVGVAIVGTSKIKDQETIVTYMYIPVRAMPIQNLIYDCGNSIID